MDTVANLAETMDREKGVHAFVGHSPSLEQCYRSIL